MKSISKKADELRIKLGLPKSGNAFDEIYKMLESHTVDVKEACADEAQSIAWQADDEEECYQTIKQLILDKEIL